MKKAEKIQIKLNYGTDLVVLPLSTLALIDKAKKFDIKVLLLLASSEKYREAKYLSKIASELGCEESDVETSIAFWNGAGVLNITNASENKVESPKKAIEKNEENNVTIAKRVKVTELPQYTSAELNALLKKHTNIVSLIDECQNILGKIFTASEIKVLMGLVDYLGLDHDYILVLMHHSARKEIKSMRYIEKMAVSCLDEGYTEASVLQEALYAKEEVMDLENQIRNVFGMGSRKFTTKEKKQVENWISTYKFTLDILEKAYEITIGATNKPSIHYANAILEKWYSEGVRNMDDVDALIAKREEEKGTEGSSFNVDDFFDAALKRSYSDKG